MRRPFPLLESWPPLVTTIQYADVKSLITLLTTCKNMREFALLKIFSVGRLSDIKIPREFFPIAFFLLQLSEKKLEKPNTNQPIFSCVFENFPNRTEQWLAFLFGVMPTTEGLSVLFPRINLTINDLFHSIPQPKKNISLEEILRCVSHISPEKTSQPLKQIQNDQLTITEEPFLSRLRNCKDRHPNNGLFFRETFVLCDVPSNCNLFTTLLHAGFLVLSLALYISAGIFATKCSRENDSLNCLVSDMFLGMGVVTSLIHLFATKIFGLIRNCLGMLSDVSFISNELEKLHDQAGKPDQAKKAEQFCNLLDFLANSQHTTVVEIPEIKDSTHINPLSAQGFWRARSDALLPPSAAAADDSAATDEELVVVSV